MTGETDRTFAIDPNGDLSNAAAAGTYELDGEIVAFTNGLSAVCGEGETWAWEVGLDRGGKNDLLHVAFTEPGCFVPTGQMWNFRRVG